MSEFNISIPGGESKRLKTGGKYCPADILVTSEKSGPVVEKDINFWDYDGTLLYSYTLEEAQVLKELPKGPDWHEGLVFYGWNWTLEEVQSLTYQVDIGALYGTVDRATHLYIFIEHDADKTVPLTLKKYQKEFGYVDWGDGSAVESVNCQEATTCYHTYNETGSYVIRVFSEAGNGIYIGSETASANAFDENTSDVCVKSTLLQKVHFGKSAVPSKYSFSRCSALEYCTFYNADLPPDYVMQYCYNLKSLVYGNGGSAHGFRDCYSLRTVCMPQTHASIKAAQFRNCRSLTRLRCISSAAMSETYNLSGADSIIEARGKTNIGNTSFFSACYNLKKFEFHASSTGIGATMFSGCYSLMELDIPEKVTTIGAQAFNNCKNMRKIRFRSSTPPSVANANAFTGIPTVCVFEVPAESLEAYQNATNYASIAAQMVGV